MHAFFDFIMLAIAVTLAVMGARRGFIREVFRFAAMLGGFFISFLFYRDLQSALSSTMANQQAVAVFSFMAVFIACFFAITGIGLLLRKFTKMVMLGWLDSTVGGALGVLKAGLIAWAACLSISSMPIQKVQAEFGNSFVYKTYRAMPSAFSLASLEAARDAIRGRKDAKKTDDDDDDDVLKKFFNDNGDGDGNDGSGGEISGGKKKPKGKKNKSGPARVDA